MSGASVVMFIAIVFFALWFTGQMQQRTAADIEAQQQSQQQSQPVSYVIQPGDTLIGISTRQYGNDSYVQAICELNGISNPDNIQIGQKILLP